MKSLAIALAVLVPVMAVASEPGQPLDCSDWVFPGQGLTCSVVIPSTHANLEYLVSHDEVAFVDNLGRLFRLGVAYIGNCGSLQLFRHELVFRTLPFTDTVVASVDDRCVDPVYSWVDQLAIQGQLWDSIAGRVLIHVYPRCDGWPPPGACQDYTGGVQLIGIDGFAPLLEVVQSYAPTTPISFVIPKLPEGLPGADHFDTYYGPLSGPKDFSQAQALRCNYPAAPPQPGEYLEVGIVPDPPSRQGYYYVTAATYQGETRYGRKRESGVLSGRDPAGLPPCVQPLPPSDGTSITALRSTP